MGEIVASVHGRSLGLDADGRLVNRQYDDNGGDPKKVSILLFAALVASTAISNTVAESLFDQNYSIPAGSLKVGDVLKIRFQGIATATNSTDTLLIRLRIGGVAGTVLLLGAATDVANNNIFAGECELVVRAIGATGAIVGVGTHTRVPAASGTATQDITDILASTAIDTTVAQQVGVTATWSVASAGNSVRLDYLRIEKW